MGQNVEWKKRRPDVDMDMGRFLQLYIHGFMIRYLIVCIIFEKKLICTINNYAYSILFTLDIISSRHFFPIRHYVPFGISHGNGHRQGHGHGRGHGQISPVIYSRIYDTVSNCLYYI